MNALRSVNYDGFISLVWDPAWVEGLDDLDMLLTHFSVYLSRFERESRNVPGSRSDAGRCRACPSKRPDGRRRSGPVRPPVFSYRPSLEIDSVRNPVLTTRSSPTNPELAPAARRQLAGQDLAVPCVGVEADLMDRYAEQEFNIGRDAVAGV